MQSSLSLFIARRLAGNDKRSFSRLIIRICSVAVALSIAVMIAASAFIAGFKSEISNKIFGFWGHIHITETSYSLSFEPTPISINQTFYPSLKQERSFSYEPEEVSPFIKTDADGLVRSKGGFRQIQAYAHKPGIIRTKTAMEGIILKGVGTDFDWQNMAQFIIEGRPIATNDTAPSRDILISQQTARRLEVKVGDKFIIYFVNDNEQLKRVFQVCGIYNTGLEEYDRKFALTDLRTVQDLLNWDSTQVAGFEIWLDDIRDMRPAAEYLYYDRLPEDLLSVSIREKFPAIFDWLELQNYNEVVILGLMLIVALMNMITTMLVLVLEHTNMIGILKTFGTTDRVVRNVFLYYGTMILVRGMLWGNALGLGFCWLQSHFRFIKLKEADYYLSYAPIKINWAMVIGLNVGTLLITVLFLLLPGYLVTRITPIKAIQVK
jgi:lipoprotein-releasing system permease protein